MPDLAAISHAVDLAAFANWLAARALAALAAHDKALHAALIEVAEALPAGAPNMAKLDALLKKVREINAEAYAYHREMLTKSPENYNPQIRQNLSFGASVTAADYIDARRELDDWRAKSPTLFPNVDLLLTPTTPGPAFPLGKPGTLLYLRNTALWNLFGLPTISVPCGFTKAGLPVGLQITGRAGEDALVLAAAAAFQKNNPFRRPPAVG